MRSVVGQLKIEWFKMKLCVGDDLTDQELKCLIAIKETKVECEVGPIDPKYVMCKPYLNVGTERIFTANAICRYLSEQAKESLMSDDLAVDDFVEWEETELEPIVSKLKKQPKDAILLVSLRVLLQDKKSAFANSFLVFDRLTIADIIVGVTLKSALSFLSDSECPQASDFVARLFQLPSFQSQTATPAVSIPEIELDPKALNGETCDSVLNILQQLFTQAVRTAFNSLSVDFTAEVTRSKAAKHGDYQCNSAMSVFKQVKGQVKSPRDVGQAIVDAMASNPVIQKMEVAGPGFVNVFVTPSFLAARVSTILNDGVRPIPCKKMRIAVDFSSPNIAKDMHVGHLRSTIIGDAMCRVLEFQGHEVLRINHVGDWGTQFGMLICYLMDSFPNWKVEMPDIQDLTLLYKNAKKRFDEDADFKQRSRDQVALLQGGDEASREAWQLLCQVSRLEFQKVYDRLKVRLEEFGESHYNDMIPGVIDILKKQNLTEDSNGALVVFTKKYKQPLIMQKSDGSFLYDSTDMAAIWYRLTQLKADWVIYYTDYSQNDHFGLFFEVSRMANIIQPHHRVDHIGFGTVNDETGKRFKTRSGEVVRLVDLLDEAKSRMKERLLERIESGQTSLPKEEVDAAAEKIGYGAVKYFDLRQSPTSNYIFSFDRMLSTTGDTAVYLLFAYARLSSIIRKSQVDVSELKKNAKIDLAHPAEHQLALELAQFQDTIEFIKKDLMSNRLCSYLYTVADKVQSFVTVCRVLGSEEQSSRLLLCSAAVQVMHTCFSLLGIEPLDQI